MVVPEILESGNICPQTGVWRELETSQFAVVSRGERFPLVNKKISKWKLKSPAKPVPLTKKQLEVFPWVESSIES